MLNQICIAGRLTAAPELKQTNSGTAVTSFSVAVERDYVEKGSTERPVDFVPCSAWRKIAEFICKHFDKGQMICVSGSLESRKYTDKEGKQRTAWEVVVSNVYFCESKKSTGEAKQTGELQDGFDLENAETGDLPF